MNEALLRAAERLEFLFEEKLKRQQEMKELNNRSEAERDEKVDLYQRNLDAIQIKIENRLEQLIRNPPHHARHTETLKAFYSDFKTPEEGFQQSVFIMTKFPRREGDPSETMADRELRTIIRIIEAAIEACGYKARIADERQPSYHETVWDEVELYLLGCSKGVAIVEDKYMPELNPNVALEWGWMRAMGRKVLFLQEQSFKHARADIHGFIFRTFNWENPTTEIQQAVEQLLLGKKA